MKKLLFFLSLIISSFFSCRKPKPPVPYTQSPDYHKAQSLLYKNSDSAFYYFNKVVSNARDSLQIAMAYNNMAVIQSDAGDYFGSQESLLTSLKFLNDQKENDINCLSSDYNELGLNSLNLKNYDAAVGFFDCAWKISKESAFKLVILNNKALAYQKKGAYSRAIRIYGTIAPQMSRDKKDLARLMTNLASAKWLQNPNYNAAPELLKALEIRKGAHDLWGQNSSYAHLADYYTPFRPDSAFGYAGEMYAVARRLSSPDDQLEALQKLISTGPVHAAKQYFKIYQRLDDSVQTARGAAKNQFALIRYDAQKNKTENLRLQKDNAESKLRIFRQNIVLVIVLAVLAGGSLGAFFWYRKRKQRMELEARNAIQESRLKISKKVHDVVANGLYQMMSEVENRVEVDRERLLDRIEVLYERSRDISYEAPQPVYQDFHKKIPDLLLSFATPHTKVVLVGNDEAFWVKTDTRVKQEIEIILQELMVNMKKHSRAGNVVIKFVVQEETCFIDYMDDGVGMAEGVPHKNGLRNTGNRIKGINGRLIFDTQPGRGLHIQLSFPIV